MERMRLEGSEHETAVIYTIPKKQNIEKCAELRAE
jgi:hypothetical protein